MAQAARELMLAQSSDWAFIMDAGTVVEYAIRRFKAHCSRFHHLYNSLLSERIDPDWLAEVERRDNIFPNLDYHVYLPKWKREEQESHLQGQGQDGQAMMSMGWHSGRPSRPPLRILMLAWEYPPMVVGGLSRHVYDLSRFLASQGEEVHVVTTDIHGYSNYEVVEGVKVHRVTPYQAKAPDFMDWTFQLNLAMIDHCEALLRFGLEFGVMHAHDWLVEPAAKTLKHEFDLPLVATIHATEYGRNQGIHTELQRKIHSIELELTYEAKKVIACSWHMKDEIERIFGLPSDKVTVIPNGVDPALLCVPPVPRPLHLKTPGEKLVFFVGRMVREKGVHVLLESVPIVLAECPEAKFVIAGKGPMLDCLRQQAESMGLGQKVSFTGFVDDETRNRFFTAADVAVFPSLYEPFGIVALEAMATGVPVVVSDTSGLSEIIEHGSDGFKVPCGDVGSLAWHIIQLFKHPDLAANLASKGKDKARNAFAWTRIATETTALYEKLLVTVVSNRRLA